MAEEQATIKMQAMMRGRQARKQNQPRLQKLKEERLKQSKLKHKRKFAAKKSLSMKREKIMEEEDQERTNAIIKLQAIQRGRSTKRKYERAMDGQRRQTNNRSTRSVSRNNSYDRNRGPTNNRSPRGSVNRNNSYDRNSSAIRGSPAKRKSNRSSPRKKSNRKKLQQRFERQERQEAITKIQAVNRGRKVRSDMREQRKREQAAAQIQARIRGMQGRQNVKKIKRKKRKAKSMRPIDTKFKSFPGKKRSPRGKGRSNSPRDRNQKMHKQGKDGPSPRRRNGKNGERTLRIPPAEDKTRSTTRRGVRPNAQNWLDDLSNTQEALLPAEPTPLELVMSDRSIIPARPEQYQMPVSFARQKGMPSVPKSLAVPGMHWSHVYAPIDEEVENGPKNGRTQNEPKGPNRGRNAKQLKRPSPQRRNNNNNTTTTTNNNNQKKRSQKKNVALKPANGYNPESPKKWAKQQNNLKQKNNWQDKWQTEWLQWLNWHSQQDKRNNSPRGNVQKPEVVRRIDPTTKKKKRRRNKDGPETNSFASNPEQNHERQKKMMERAMQRQALEITRNSQQYATPEYIPPPMAKVVGGRNRISIEQQSQTRSAPMLQQRQRQQQQQQQQQQGSYANIRKNQNIRNNNKGGPVPRKPQEDKRAWGQTTKSPRKTLADSRRANKTNATQQHPLQNRSGMYPSNKGGNMGKTSHMPWKSRSTGGKTKRQKKRDRFVDDAANMLLRQFL